MMQASQELKHRKEQEANTQEKIEVSIFAATQNGDCSAIEKLLKQDKKLIECRDKEHLTPLMLACSHGQLNAVKLLLDYGADQDALTQNKRMSIDFALNNGHESVAQLLLACGPKNKRKSYDKDKLLVGTLPFGHLSSIKLLLMCGASAEAKSDTHFLIHLAAKQRDSSVIGCLLDKDANINSLTLDKNKETPAIIAAKNNNTNGVRYLLERGADVNKVDANGDSVLHWAAYTSSCEIAALLLNALAKPEQLNIKGFTPLNDACYDSQKECSPEIVHLLLGFGLNPNQGIYETNKIISQKCLESYTHLVNNGFDIRSKCIQNGKDCGHDLLSFAIQYESPELVSLCLNQNIDPKIIISKIESNARNKTKNGAIIGELLACYKLNNQEGYVRDCLQELNKLLQDKGFGDDVNTIILQYYSSNFKPQLQKQPEQNTIELSEEQKKRAEEEQVEKNAQANKNTAIDSIFRKAISVVQLHDSETLSKIIKENAEILTAKDKQGDLNVRDTQSYTLLQHAVLWNRPALVTLILEKMKASLTPEEMEKVLQHRLEKSKWYKGFTAYDLAKEKVKNPYIIAALAPYYEKADSKVSTSSSTNSQPSSSTSLDQKTRVESAVS